MFMLVDSNEGTDRAKKKREKATELGKTIEDGSNLRMIERLRKRFPELEVTHLDCGDIKVILDNGNIFAIERKRAGDFLGSIAEGHIFKQVERMHAASKWCCVIIEGLIRYDKDDMAVIPVYDKNDNLIKQEVTGWHGKSVRGAMYAIQWSGCPIVTVEPYDLPAVVSDLINFCTKPQEHYTGMGRRRVVTFPPVELCEDIVATLPGVGFKRARALKEFARGQNDKEVSLLGEMLSWASMMHMLDRKVRPEGWGDKTIENVRAALGLAKGEYLVPLEDGDYRVVMAEKERREKAKSRKSNGR